MSEGDVKELLYSIMIFHKVSDPFDLAKWINARRIALDHRDGRLKPSVISPEETTQLRKNMRANLRPSQE